VKILVPVKRVPDPTQKAKVKDGHIDLTGIGWHQNFGWGSLLSLANAYDEAGFHFNAAVDALADAMLLRFHAADHFLL